MVVLNHLDRYQLALDVVRRVPRFASLLSEATAQYWRTMERHKLYVCEHGEDMPEVVNWRWAI
jgi:xylulose-5-phosphate/fructose-6-phosphate phosphoketolase